MAVQTSTIYAMQPVKAGDLITAQFVNKLVAALLDLDARVRVLEARPQPGTGTGTPSPPAGLNITSAVLTTIGQTTAINVVGSGLEPAGLNRFRINNIPFTPLGNVLGDDDEIIIPIPPNADAQILAAIRNAGRSPFTLTLDSRGGQVDSASVGGLTFDFGTLVAVNPDFVFTARPEVSTIVGAGTTVGPNVAANVGNIASAGSNVGANIGSAVAGNVGANVGSAVAGNVGANVVNTTGLGANFGTLAARFIANRGTDPGTPE